MKNSSTLRCAIAKTIGLIVGVFLVASFHVWLGKTFGPDIFGEIAKVIAMLTPFVILFILVYISCEESNQQTVKKTTPVQSKTEPAKQKITSTQSDVQRIRSIQSIKPTKQYPVLGEIQKIISNLTELEKKQDLDKNLFIQFHTLKKQFNSDYQEIVNMLNTLEEIDEFDDTHLESFKKYLDVFKKQQQMIYDNIKHQYNDKLNTINEQLQHFN